MIRYHRTRITKIHKLSYVRFKSSLPVQEELRQHSFNKNSHHVPKPIWSSSMGRQRLLDFAQPSFNDRLIMNTLSKVQQLIIQETEIDEPLNYSYDSRLENFTIKDDSFVSYLLRQQSDAPKHIQRDMRKTFDSHAKLDKLLSYPTSLDILPQLYLKSYLRVRYNIDRLQVLKILEKLFYHRWYKNGCLLILENSKSIDDVLSLSEELIDLITSKAKDGAIGVDEFLIHFQNESILPQVLKNYVSSSVISDKFLFIRSLKRIVQLGKMVQEQTSDDYIEQFESVSEISSYLDELIGVYEIPLSVRLQIVSAKIRFIKSTESNTKKSKMMLNHLLTEEMVNDEFRNTIGVMSRLISQIEPQTSDLLLMLYDLSQNFQLSSLDYTHLLRTKLSLNQVSELYERFERAKLDDANVTSAFVDKFLVMDPSRLLDIFKQHRNHLSLYHVGRILTSCRKDPEKIKEIMQRITRDHYGYVLTAMSKSICYEYSQCLDKSKLINFLDIFQMVNVFKYFRVDHHSYLNNIFHEIIMDDDFISEHRYEFSEAILKFASESRVNLELLSEWNKVMFNRYKKTGDSFLVNSSFNRKFLIMILRLQTEERRKKLLQEFGSNLSILPPEIVKDMFNEIINNIPNERGRNVIDIKIASTMIRQVLESYVGTSLQDTISLEELYRDLSYVLTGIEYKQNKKIDIILKSNPLHDLMRLLTAQDPRLGGCLIKEETNTSLIKGYLLGVMASDKLTSNEKILLFDGIVLKKFRKQNKSFLGQKVVINLCNLIITKLNENDVSRLTHVQRLLWLLKQCEFHGVDLKFYSQWYKSLKQMKADGKGYWSVSAAVSAKRG